MKNKQWNIVSKTMKNKCSKKKIINYMDFRYWTKDTPPQENTTSLLLNVALQKLARKVWLARGACKIKFPQPFGSLELRLNNWWGQWVVAVSATVIWLGASLNGFRILTDTLRRAREKCQSYLIYRPRLHCYTERVAITRQSTASSPSTFNETHTQQIQRKTETCT